MGLLAVARQEGKEWVSWQFLGKRERRFFLAVAGQEGKEWLVAVARQEGRGKEWVFWQLLGRRIKGGSFGSS